MNAVTFGLHAGVSDWDVYLHTLPMFHANGGGCPARARGARRAQVVLRKVDGTEILTRVEAARRDVHVRGAGGASPRCSMRGAWAGAGAGAGRATRVVVAGAPPPSKTIERVEVELGWEFCQIYGLTETSPLLTINRRRREQADAADLRGLPRAGPGGRSGNRGALEGRATRARCWRGPTSSSRATGSSPR